jgi:hypothetical protein
MAQPSEIAQLRERRDAALAAATASADRQRTLDSAIANAERAGDQAELSRLQSERAAAERTAAAAAAEYERLRAASFDGVVNWLAQTPEEIVAQLSDNDPFVLLPFRIETKFSRVGDQAELRVRVYPDDIAISSPPPPVGDRERALGQAYWRARAAARHSPGDAALRQAQENAFATIATYAGPYRAGYILRMTRPANPDAAPGDLVFNEPVSSEAAPVARSVLPDRFVILAYRLDPTTRVPLEIARAVGAPIPDDLVLAPDSSQTNTSLTRDASTGRLIAADRLKWMIDFEAAVQVGMAVRMSLTPPHDASGFDRVLAIGIRSATPAAAGPALLETLLANHRDTHGLGLLRAGTPTKNSDSATSGWPPETTQDVFATEDAPPDLTPRQGLLGTTDGWRLADLFGISLDLVRRLPNAAATDIAEALTMNRALAPGTIDDFVREFLGGLVGPEAAQNLHRFFLERVTGRGFFPAIHIGRQPYGIVLTAAWHNLELPPEAVQQSAIGSALHDLLVSHRTRWQMVPLAAPRPGETGADAFQRLLATIGQLASSSEFYSRKAVSDQYIRERLSFGGADQNAIQSWFSELERTRSESLARMGFPPAAGPTDPLLAFIVFLRETAAWRLPIVDRDPEVPLSERDPVRSYDGKRNYLMWLTQAAREDLANQHFLGADGSTLPPPTALLYVLLHQSLLAAIEADTLDAASQRGRRFFDVVERDPLIANIGSEQHVLRRDYLEVDAARLGLTRTRTALADWALAAARGPAVNRPVEVERIAEVHESIAALADLPTARLERLLAEHIDLCSYRLDAWITALYAERLALIRGRSETRGLNIGAFGFVENVRPAARQRLASDTLPPALREGSAPVFFRDEANGGYVHAPSLVQAASAAVLRNGYLSHAGPEAAQRFAVDLSSARVRAALALAEGVRGGQPLGALLGYQLERGLHEGHPRIELDSAIYTLRDRFPLLSGRLTELPAGVSAEVIEARNVVDGLALSEATKDKDYPYDLSGLPVDSAAAHAITTEIDRLHDTLDALSDVLLAESVHQAVQGNLTRTKASLDALTAPEAPPEPEVIRTPRTGRVLAFRAALACDAASTAGWTAALSPRARANPQINHWLAQQLPAAGSIRWTVVDAGTSALQSLEGLGLEPLDLVLISGEHLGDQSSELERFLIGHYRMMHAVPDDRATIVAPAGPGIDPARTLLIDFGTAPEGISLAAVQPLLARLRRLITRARAAHAADWRRSADADQADRADPTGSASGDARLVAFKDLTDRLDAAAADLTTATEALRTARAALAPLAAALTADPNSIASPAWLPALSELRRRLETLVAFGMPEAQPVAGLTVSPVLIGRLTAQAETVVALATQRLARAAKLRATSFASPLPADEPARSREIARRNGVLRESYGDAAKALFGEAFVITPLFRFVANQSNEIQASLTTPPVNDSLVIEEWLQSLARVRPALADLAWALAMVRWTGRAASDSAFVQLPHRAGAPFIGGAFATGLPAGELLGVLTLNSAALAAPLKAGLLVDEWTETVPAERETTGLAFNVDRPNAVAPQAILVAVPARLSGHWTFDELVGAVHEALDLAKLRAIEPDALIGGDAQDGAGAYFQGLPAILSQFTAGRLATTDFVAVATTMTTEA